MHNLDLSKRLEYVHLKTCKRILVRHRTGREWQLWKATSKADKKPTSKADKKPTRVAPPSTICELARLHCDSLGACCRVIFTKMKNYLFIHLVIYLYLLICVWLFVCLFLCVWFCLFVCLFVCLSVCLSVCLFDCF